MGETVGALCPAKSLLDPLVYPEASGIAAVALAADNAYDAEDFVNELSVLRFLTLC